MLEPYRGRTLIYTEKLILRPVPPFDFDLSMILFSEGDRQIRKYENGKFWQVFRINGGLILAILEAEGSVDDPKLLVYLKSDRKISLDSKQKVRQTVKRILNLDLNLKAFYGNLRSDTILTEVIHKLRGLRGPTTSTVFEALVDSIIEQQISLNVAHVLETRLIKAFGESLSLDNEVYYAYPTPERLASTRLLQLRKCGLSQKKAEYITGVSVLVATGQLNLERLRYKDDTEQIVAELDKIRGIGVWTAELTLVRGTARMDVMPADDLGLRRTISHFYRNDERISGQEARKIGEKWGRWKGLAAFYLIVAEVLEQKQA